MMFSKSVFKREQTFIQRGLIKVGYVDSLK